jgi:hypothetical protein
LVPKILAAVWLHPQAPKRRRLIRQGLNSGALQSFPKGIALRNSRKQAPPSLGRQGFASWPPASAIAARAALILSPGFKYLFPACLLQFLELK